ncbi:MAG: NAD(P)H-dependent oxidoreductase [Proteobacteria bacterium]|nr:NAD(P)H-dependent oxidoreductase [Pseudomonadota bacterium]
MKRLLHIIATPREDQSRTLEISQVFLDAFIKHHPDWVIDQLNLSKEELPNLSQKNVSGKYMLLDGKDLFGSLKETWAEIVQHIERFKTADRFLISTPMWNFSIPYMLKQYIDLIVQPRYLFHYVDDQPEGLIKGKKMLVITSRGGQYGNAQALDNQEPYLRTIFGFVGITDITFVKADGMDMGEEIRNEALSTAKKQAQVLTNA